MSERGGLQREKDELLIRELSGLTGVELEYSDDRICDLVVDGRIVVLRYRPDDGDWLYFGVVSESDDELPKDILAKALELNLFGTETSGFHLGLFGNALVLSGSASMDGLTAEDFADRLLSLSRQIGKLAGKLEMTDGTESVPSSGGLSSPWDSGFMQV